MKKVKKNETNIREEEEEDKAEVGRGVKGDEFGREGGKQLRRKRSERIIRMRKWKTVTTEGLEGGGEDDVCKEEKKTKFLFFMSSH